MKRKSLPVTNIGSASLLVVFIVLCLVTFATLSLSSAASDYQYSERIAQHNTQYCQASNEAVLKLKEIDSILLDAYQSSPASYLKEARRLLEKDKELELNFTRDDTTVTYQQKISENRAVSVVLALNAPEDFSGGLFRISSWQEITTEKWKGDDRLKLIE